jgi:hypothetical protein
MIVKTCLAGVLALALFATQAKPDAYVRNAGVNEDVKVDVRLVPVPTDGSYRGNVNAFVRFLDPEGVDRSCGTLPGKRVIACVDRIGAPVMTLPNPCNVEFQGEDYASVVCHEKGHALGWRHEYPSFTRKTREK